MLAQGVVVYLELCMVRGVGGERVIFWGEGKAYLCHGLSERGGEYGIEIGVYGCGQDDHDDEAEEPA